MEGEGVLQPMSKAEIDTSAPFRSVKEAVMLFGDRVLASEVYGSKLKEMQDGTMIEYGNETVTSDELEETKQCLQKAREESLQMATSLFFLQQELEQTKMELQQLKIRESDHHRQPVLDSEIEDVKFVEDSRGLIEQVMRTETIISRDQKVEFQKKKYVTFANPPCVAQVVVPNPPSAEAVLQRHPSLKKKKKMQLIPLIRGIFSKKKGTSEVALA
ncbi:hypothetical protein Pfo_017058 [Paulownia fortunei]|nr:hypothetical protein Pfo_017058 [Paulownia fortunei]